MIRATRSLDYLTPEPVHVSDLRLFRVDATDHDTEFYVRCAEYKVAVDIVQERAELKRLPFKWREITEVTK